MHIDYIAELLNQIDNYIIFFESMNGVLTSLCPLQYYVFVPFCPQFSTTEWQVPSSSQIAPNINAEINQAESLETQKINVTKQDLLQEGYAQTKKAWTEEQDALLLQLCKNQNVRFPDVAVLMPGRNAKMCYSRYRRLVNHSKECWSKAEDAKLRDLVAQYGTDNWKLVAEHFTNRNFKQLKDRYDNYLRPNLTSDKWTLEEDLHLIDLVNTNGKDWKLIQSKMQWRSRNQIKNRFFGRILRLDGKKKEISSKERESIKQQDFTY